MELTKFCPRCGKETEELYGEGKKLCAECYPDKHDLVDIPNKVEMKVCTVCGRMSHHGEWIEEYTLEDQLAKKFSKYGDDETDIALQYWEEDQKMYVRVHATRGDIQAHYDTELILKKEQCQQCAKFEGGFYKVKMQLRGEDVEPISHKIVDKAAEATNESRTDFLSNIEEVDNGYNFYMSTESMAKMVLRMLRSEYNPEIKRSYELITENREGQRVYRNVISVRIND